MICWLRLVHWLHISWIVAIAAIAIKVGRVIQATTTTSSSIKGFVFFEVLFSVSELILLIVMPVVVLVAQGLLIIVIVRIFVAVVVIFIGIGGS